MQSLCQQWANKWIYSKWLYNNDWTPLKKYRVERSSRFTDKVNYQRFVLEFFIGLKFEERNGDFFFFLLNNSNNIVVATNKYWLMKLYALNDQFFEIYIFIWLRGVLQLEITISMYILFHFISTTTTNRKNDENSKICIKND